MELIRISEQKLKIMLTPSDMTAFDLHPELFGEDCEETQRSFRLLLEEIHRQIGFDVEDRRFLIQYFPSREGGCEMFVSSNPACSEERRRLSFPKVAGALTVRSGKQTAPVFRRDGAYRFENLDHLLRACRRLCDAGYIGDSSAYRDENGSYFLLLSMVSSSPFSMPDEFAFLSEYGDVENPTLLRIWIREHARPICLCGAVSTLGALS